MRAPAIAYVDIDAPSSPRPSERESAPPRTLRSHPETEARAPEAHVETPRSAPRARGVDPRTRGAIVRGAYYVGIGAGALVPAVGLIDSVASTARMPLVGLAATALLVRAAIAERDPAEPHPIVALAAALGA